MYAIARSNGFTDRESDPAAVDAFIKERTTFRIDLKSNQSGKGSNSGKGGSYPVVPHERNVIFQPIQDLVTKKNEPDRDETCNDPEDNDDEITVPDEPPAKGPVRATTRSVSARPLRTHYKQGCQGKRKLK